ncbi:2-hydroxyacid dehydrogenase [Pelagibacterium montanilacus]|uniref:2-hydroxyacid dehydrogenase n=1 Tax=Pelagibacterium montanilacus TaxID=2185280 RepID=UPI000F8E181B|nr:2-hydroxyacid dehydrogenase [Pelagibacterium montanilacus]
MSTPEILQVSRYPEAIQAQLEQRFKVHRYFDAADPSALLDDVGPKIRAIATNGEVGASRSLIEACQALELISVFGVGYDPVDVKACRDHQVKVTNTPDVLTADVADLAVGMMLCLGRSMVPAHHWVTEGKWAERPFPLSNRVQGRKAGILGLGRIGESIGRRLLGFDMDIGYYSRAAKAQADASWTYFDTPEKLAAHSDFLFVSVAAGAQTRHIVDEKVISALGPQGMLINISRGANVDETALLAALTSGTLGWAALDVFQNEPTIDPQFLALENVLLQPHHGSGTHETRRAMGQLVIDNLSAHFEGKPLLTPAL